MTSCATAGADKLAQTVTTNAKSRTIYPHSKPNTATNLPEQFLQTYRDEGFAADDPFIQYCLPSRISISTGIAYLDDYDYLTNRAGDLIELAATAGFRAGFSVSTVRPGHAGAEGWNIGSSLSRKEVEAIRKHHGRDITLGLLALRGRLTGPRHRLTPPRNRCDAPAGFGMQDQGNRRPHGDQRCHGRIPPC